MNNGSANSAKHLIWAVGWVSAAVLGFEIALMRVLLVASWHHFAFLVISVVLLGLGASGTALTLLRDRLLPRAEGVLWGLVLATAASMPVCATVAQWIPVEARLVPALMWEQIAYWIAFWAVLTVPFLLGGAAVGLALMIAGGRLPAVYAANLAGSALGGLLATLAMYVITPAWLGVAMGAVGVVGGVTLGPRRPAARMGGIGAAVGLVAVLLVLFPPRVRPDPDKYATYLDRLVQQGAAERVASAIGPRSMIEAYASDAFHDIPFLAVGAAPPPMLSLAADGHWFGSVLRIDDASGAAAVEQTMMAFPYALAPRDPRVLLLGESGGRNIWLAKRHGASEIHAVQPDTKVIRLMSGPLREFGGLVFGLDEVEVHTVEPRHFVEHHAERFDIVQLAVLEGTAAGSGGLGGLAQDYLVTVQGIQACLERLTDRGTVFACRGIQTPPRDNLKLMATFVRALRRVGIDRPERHLLVVRDYLAVCTVARRSAWTAEEIARVRQVCAERQLTPVWFPGIRVEELNQPDALPQPPSGEGDWYHYAATQLFGAEAAEFLESWPFAIRPPTDDRPFFMDFCKLGSLGRLKEAFGDFWLTRSELAFPFVLAATALIGVIGGVLTLVPLAFVRTRRSYRRRGATVAYFAAIGLGYLLVEMTFLSRLAYLIGDPVQNAAITISTFLLASGLGSLTAQRRLAGRGVRMGRLFLAIVALGAVELLMLGRLGLAAGGLETALRAILAVAVISPLGYLMGFAMPAALTRLDRGAPAMIPWAWGVNGFASVLAAPLAVTVSMSWGHAAAGLCGVAMYAVAGAAFARLPEGDPQVQGAG